MIYRLAKTNSIPVVSTLAGLGCFPAGDELYLGMLGMHAAPYTNFIVDEADLILAFGVRFGDRATGLAHKFCRNAKIIHIDIDNAEIGKIKKSRFSICGDIKAALKRMLLYQ